MFLIFVSDVYWECSSVCESISQVAHLWRGCIEDIRRKRGLRSGAAHVKLTFDHVLK